MSLSSLFEARPNPRMSQKLPSPQVNHNAALDLQDITAMSSPDVKSNQYQKMH